MSQQSQKNELNELLDAVEVELRTEVENTVSQARGLAKADASPLDEPEASVAPSAPMAEAPSEEISPEAGAEAFGGEESYGEESMEASPEMAPEGPGAEAGGDPVAQLQAEYAQLPPEDLKYHYLAIKAVLFQAMGGGPEASMEGDMGAGAPPPPAASPAPPPAPAFKSEGSIEGERLAKSEEKVQQLEVGMAALTEAFTLSLGKPIRKAVTSVAHLGKPGDVEVSGSGVPINLSKSEIVTKMNEICRTQKLSKSDRNLINDVVKGDIGVDKVQHLMLQA